MTTSNFVDKWDKKPIGHSLQIAFYATALVGLAAAYGPRNLAYFPSDTKLKATASATRMPSMPADRMPPA